MLYCRIMSRRDSQPEESVSVPVRMPKALAERVTKASEKTKLAKQDVMRLSMERGIDILVAQLSTPPAAPAVPALPLAAAA